MKGDLNIIDSTLLAIEQRQHFMRVLMAIKIMRDHDEALTVIPQNKNGDKEVLIKSKHKDHCDVLFKRIAHSNTLVLQLSTNLANNVGSFQYQCKLDQDITALMDEELKKMLGIV